MSSISKHTYHAEAESFFARPFAKWLALFIAAATFWLCYHTFQVQPSVEDMLKVLLLSVPVSLYLVFRSFVREA